MLLLQRALLDSPNTYRLFQSSWRRLTHKRHKESGDSKSKAFWFCFKREKKKKKKEKKKKKKRLTTEHVSFGLQTTPEIETEVLRHQTVRGKC